MDPRLILLLTLLEKFEIQKWGTSPPKIKVRGPRSMRPPVPAPMLAGILARVMLALLTLTFLYYHQNVKRYHRSRVVSSNMYVKNSVETTQ